ncbi:MAG: hypothetical protein RBR02_09605 [Desulfuromonadaceae bacterium]|nr:hypothetical protein [Desulfuromonadaceae bacterium]
MPLPAFSASTTQAVDLYNTASTSLQNIEIYDVIKIMIVTLINYLFAPVMFFFAVIRGLHVSTKVGNDDNFIMLRSLFLPFIYVLISLFCLFVINSFFSFVFHQPASAILKSFFEFDLTQTSSNTSALLKHFFDGTVAFLGVLRNSIVHLTAAAYAIIPILYCMSAISSINISVDSPFFIVFRLTGMLGVGVIVTNVYANLANTILFSSAPNIEGLGVISSVSRLSVELLKSYVRLAYN